MVADFATCIGTSQTFIDKHMKYEEDISIIHLLCYALYGFSHVLQKERLLVMGLCGAILALVWIFCALYFTLFFFSFHRPTSDVW